MELCKGKKVLDIGCVGGNGGIIHKKIASVVCRITGIDIDKEGIEKLRMDGYNVKIADAENFNLNEHFELIISGELLEHLTNVGGFLECVKNHLLDGGKLILTTPNISSIIWLIGDILHGGTETMTTSGSMGHTSGFNHNMLETLLARHGFRVVEKAYFNDDTRSLIKFITKLAPRHSLHIGVVAEVVK